MRVGDPDGGEVLRSDVDALAVGLFKVVDFEEIAHKGFVGNDLWLIVHLDGLQMARGACFYLFIAWVCEYAAHETHGGVHYAFEAFEVVFDAPEAAGGEVCG